MFTIATTFWFSESFNQQMNLCITFLRTTCNVFTPALTNSSLALVHLGLFKSILKASLYATSSLWRLAFLYFNHRCAVYIGEQYAEQSKLHTNSAPTEFTCQYICSHIQHTTLMMSSSSVSWSVITWPRYCTSLSYVYFPWFCRSLSHFLTRCTLYLVVPHTQNTH